MFRIECYCHDKHLSSVLLALQGLILADPKVQPLANATLANGQLRARGDGSLVDLLRRSVKKGQVINSADVKALLKAEGRNPSSSTHTLKEGVKAGFLRKRGKGSNMTYVVLS